MQENSLTADPHSSKISPDDPRLKINRPQGRTLNKGAVIAAGLVIIGVVLISITIALWPKSTQETISEEVAEPAQQHFTIPAFITDAPAVIEEEPMTPQLGPQLPGDLGAAMVPAQQSVSNHDQHQISPEQQRQNQLEQQAMEADPFWSGLTMDNETDEMDMTGDIGHLKEQLQANQLLANMQNIQSSALPGDGLASQNMQAEKKAFINRQGQRDENYMKGQLSQPRSPYEVKAGSIIPVTLITGINSDLPGEIIGQVRENVYDSVSGHHLLIPQGSKLMAAYDSTVAFGQERILVCWNRLIRPDGSAINLECSPGVDLSGYAGFEDRVDNHWRRLMLGAVLSSVLAATASTSQGDISGESATFDQVFAANVGEEVNSVGQQLTQKNLNIQPTIEIRPGFSVNILVNKDMILFPYKR